MTWILKILLLMTALLMPLIRVTGQLLPESAHTFHSCFEKELFYDLNKSSQANPLPFVLAADTAIDKTKAYNIINDLNTFKENLKLKQKNNNYRRLQKTYHMVVKHYYTHYYYNATPAQLFTQGHYNCLSGVSLFAYLLDSLPGYRIQIKEAAFHVYLVVQSNKMDPVILETTDPVNGLVKANNRTLAQMEQDMYNQSNTDNFSTRTITRLELSGLIYYNKAVQEFNNQNYKQAFESLQKSLELYPARRIYALADLTATFALKNSDQLENDFLTRLANYQAMRKDMLKPSTL